MILAVCLRRSAFRAHFSPREIVCLPTAMTFARKIRRYRFRCIVLACKPAWWYGFTYGSGGTRFSYRALHRGDAAAMLIRSDAGEQLCLILVGGATCGATLPDFRRVRRAERLCLILVGDDAAEQLCLILIRVRRAALPGSCGEVCVKQRVPLSRPSASACAAFPSLFDCGSCRAMTHVISSIGLQKLT